MNKGKNRMILISLILCLIFLSAPKLKNVVVVTKYYGFYLDSFTGENGAVPDEDTAKKIAEMVWIKTFGEEVKKEQPYKVKYDKIFKVWIVEGALPKDMLGGTAGIIIRKSDGEILKKWHFK